MPIGSIVEGTRIKVLLVAAQHDFTPEKLLRAALQQKA